MCNKERSFPVTKQVIEEENRAKKFTKIFDTLRNIETDYPLLISSLNDRQSRTQQNFYQKTNTKIEKESHNLSSYLFSAPV